MKRAAVGLAVTIALAGAACRGPESARATSLLLVSIDTLRADHLGSYGYAQAETPRLDALAARGWRFEQAVTVTPLTLPAHCSLLTGTFPGHHGVRDNGGFYLGDEQVTLAKVLQARGYRTGAFVGAFVLDARWGTGQGFERYFDEFDLSKTEGVGLDAVQRRGDQTVEEALRWLGQGDRERPFLAWVHLYDPHTPYDAPEPFRSRHTADASGPYDAEIAWTDSLVGRLLDGLTASGRAERTLVMVVGDHGESLGEHREQTHGFFVYDATVRIPLIVAGPGVGARTVPDTVRIVDVMPTALELLGVPAQPTVQGTSLVALGNGMRGPLPALSETWFPRYHYGWSELTSIRDGRYKLIRAPRRELYDLERDPHEQDDLAAREPQRAEALARALEEMRRRVDAQRAPAAPRALAPDVEERLQALGYVGAPSARYLDDRPRGDPKDAIDLYNLLKRAGQASVDGRLDEAVRLAQEALARDPGIVEGYTLLGNFHSKARRYDQAVAAYRRALALDPDHQGAVFSLALAYKRWGRPAEAEAGFQRLRQLDPRGTKALWQIADLAMQRGDFADAERALREALTRPVDRPVFLLKLGECQLETKRYPEAEASIREALAQRPDLPNGHFDLALLHEARGEGDPAIAAYEAELTRDPTHYRAAFNLAKLLARAGRAAEALQRFRDVVARQPDFGAGHLYLAKALLDAGDLQAARAAAQRGLALKPEPAAAPLGHYVLADVYTRMGQPQAAAREVAAARRLARGL